MNSFLFQCMLFAQQGELLKEASREARGRGARVDPGYILGGLVALTVLVALLWLLSRLMERNERGGGKIDNPWVLFFNLCRAQHLSWTEGLLLWRLARFQALRDPGRLFLEPDRFERNRLGPRLRADASRLAALGERLFADIESQVETEETLEQPALDRASAEPEANPFDGLPMALFPTQESSSLDVSPWTQASESLK